MADCKFTDNLNAFASTGALSSQSQTNEICIFSLFVSWNHKLYVYMAFETVDTEEQNKERNTTQPNFV